MTLSAAARMGHRAKAEMRRGPQRRWIVLAALVLILGAAVSSALAVVLSGSPSPGVVPNDVRKIEIRSAFPNARPFASYSITDPARVGRITGLLNALEARDTTYDKGYGLGVAGIEHNLSCPLIGGPTATLELESASGHVLASGSFVTGDGMSGLSAGCNPLWFGRGRAAVADRFFHPQFALAGHNLRQANFVQQLEKVIGRPLCQRDVGASAQYCKP